MLSFLNSGVIFNKDTGKKKENKPNNIEAFDELSKNNNQTDQIILSAIMANESINEKEAD